MCPVFSGGSGYTAAAGTFLVGRLSWEVTYKNGYSCTGTAGPRSTQGIPIRQIDCFLSSAPLIHVFHLSSNEPSAVWHHSGHLCIGPSTVHGLWEAQTALYIDTHIQCRTQSYVGYVLPIHAAFWRYIDTFTCLVPVHKKDGQLTKIRKTLIT